MRYGNYMDGYFGHGITRGISECGFNSYWYMGAIAITIIVLFFIAIVYNKKKKDVSLSQAQETLKMRYVNGEITEEEYQKMKRLIK